MNGDVNSMLKYVGRPMATNKVATLFGEIEIDFNTGEVKVDKAHEKDLAHLVGFEYTEDKAAPKTTKPTPKTAPKATAKKATDKEEK